MTGPRIAIAHDYLTQRGGAERLVLSICRAFPQAQVHTLFYAPDQTYPEYRDMDIRVSPLNRIGVFRRDPRLALPVLAGAASALKIEADVVIASSSGWAHAFPTTGRKIVYCHSPARWLYLPEDYLGDASPFDPKRLGLAVLRRPLTRWDQRAARAADMYVANSSVVRERIARVYGIDAPTLFPPYSPLLVDGAQTALPAIPGFNAGADYYVVVSRLQPYKNVDRVIDAFRTMPQRQLLVIGKGPLRERLMESAPDNVHFAEGLSDANMRWAYAHAKALVAASHEDFGLTPLEAGAHGVPTIALRAGGYLDTVRDGVNGLFFDQAEAKAIAGAIHTFEQRVWNSTAVRAQAETFAESLFIDKLRHCVRDLTKP
ncbi:glycosyltransferase [Devriesea agamarum]|uniref:glycosyltransferase n=1 Tax=Devriesea agamarum TaxID=472569 RepID=UPI00071CE242|nr:glycosyltransferase [Devriesea agamarum]